MEANGKGKLSSALFSLSKLFFQSGLLSKQEVSTTMVFLQTGYEDFLTGKTTHYLNSSEEKNPGYLRYLTYPLYLLK